MQFQHWNMKIEWDLQKCASTSEYCDVISHETDNKILKNDKYIIKCGKQNFNTAQSCNDAFL